MCYNVSKELKERNIESIFISPGEDATKSLTKNNIDFKTLQQYKETIQNILEIEKPNIVITPHNLNPIGYLFVKNARKKYIPTLLLHEGGSEVSKYLRKKKPIRKKNVLRDIESKIPLTGMDKFELLLMKITKILRGKQFVAHNGSDYVAAMSPFAKQFLEELGIKANIVVTGQPRFDDIIKKEFNKPAIMKRLNLETRKKIVLILTSIFVVDGIWKSEKLESFISTLVNNLEKIEEVEPILKIHPRESVEYYKKIIGDRIKIFQDEDLYEIISVSDLIISLPSTTTVEALLFKKKILIPDFLTRKPYSEAFKTVLGCKSHEEIIENVKKNLRKDIKREEANLSYYIYKDDGKSSGRVAKLIERICK